MMNNRLQLTVLKCTSTIVELTKNKSTEADEALTGNPYVVYVSSIFNCNHIESIILSLLFESESANPHFSYTFLELASHFGRKITYMYDLNQGLNNLIEKELNVGKHSQNGAKYNFLQSFSIDPSALDAAIANNPKKVERPIKSFMIRTVILRKK